MKYLVMECHPAYAIVLAEDGRFLRVANMHYQVGQQLNEVFGLEQPKSAPVVIWKKAAEIAAAAACFCLILLGMWQMVLAPCGTVRMQINPDVAITVNRLDYVTAVEGLNEDGKQIVQGYSSSFKKLDIVTDQLADRAVEMGYLEDGGKITLTVESDSEKWKTAIEERLLLELEIHFDNRVVVEVSPSDEEHSDDSSGQEFIIPVPSPEVSGSDTGQSYQRDDDDDLDDADDDADDADDVDDVSEEVDDTDDAYEDDGQDTDDDLDDLDEDEDHQQVFDDDMDDEVSTQQITDDDDQDENDDHEDYDDDDEDETREGEDD